MGKFDGMLICTDLDGTLLRGDKTVSAENLGNHYDGFALCVEVAHSCPQVKVFAQVLISWLSAWETGDIVSANA